MFLHKLIYSIAELRITDRPGQLSNLLTVFKKPEWRYAQHAVTDSEPGVCLCIDPDENKFTFMLVGELKAGVEQSVAGRTGRRVELDSKDALLAIQNIIECFLIYILNLISHDINFNVIDLIILKLLSEIELQ